MKKKTTIKFLPFFPLILIWYSIILIILFSWFRNGIYTISSVFILISSGCCITYWEGVKLFNNKCEFYNQLLFLKFRSRIVYIDDVNEIILINMISSMRVRNFSPKASNFKGVMNERYELLIKNKNDKYILIYKSAKSNKINKLGSFFSEYYSIPIQRKRKITYHPDKEFVGDVL